MEGSIAQPDPAARRGALGRLVAALDGELRAAQAAATDASVASSLGEFVQLVRSLDPGASPREPGRSRERLSVCRFWESCLRESRGASSGVIGALETLGPYLSWAQNPNYRRKPPDPSFLDNYGYAVIAGPADGPPALAIDPRLAFGVLLLGPRAHYPLHAHPAVEIYYTLTPGGAWWLDDGPWRSEPPGTVIHHVPGVRHATRAGDSALLAIYLWRGELATHAKLTADGRAGG